MADNKIEQYLIDLMVSYREISDNFWLIEDDEHCLESVAVMRVDSIVVFRTTIMDVPNVSDEKKFALFSKLLELNATDLVHGAYAVEGGRIILIDTWEYDTLDFLEFRAVLDAFALALIQHYKILSDYRKVS
ncbi:MAG: YbjN domain-containing protein [Treponema sp.]|jgi:predicted nucleic acid-binding protein|nr:YbjN domain-containing protein [Treponema sp.]